MSEEQLLFWKKAMFPEIAEKDKEIERLKDLIKALWYRNKLYLKDALTEEQIDLLNEIIFNEGER